MSKHRSHQGASQRQLRVGELIRRTISEMLMHGDVHDPDLTRLSITISEVRVTSDMRIATVYVMPLGGEHREEAIAALARNKGALRHRVGKATALKHTPDLRFMIDETFDRMDETRRLLAEPQVRADIEKGGQEESGETDGED
ncbi:MAG: ribosome-binding factor A [Rhodobacterales bacterium]|nr:MAG: ribosome-binding factor A [Rhodobacterales bacterium]